MSLFYCFKGETLYINWKLKKNKKMLDQSNNVDSDQEYPGSSAVYSGPAGDQRSKSNKFAISVIRDHAAPTG